MLIGGIDYSMTCPAICVYNGDSKSFSFSRCKFYYLTDRKKYNASFLLNIKGEEFKDYDNDYTRYDSLSEWAMKYLTGLEQLCIEGYSFGSKGKVFHIAENTGVLKYKIFQLRIPLEVASPSQIKKMATGKGNATKEDMHDAFYMETKTNLIETITPGRTDVISPVGDIVDSYYICKFLFQKITSSS
jgi:hypothetical protein